MALSAAYAIASTASPGGLYVSQDAATGSIGAIALHLDRSRQLEQEGLAVTHFAAGRRKADMSPFKPLSGAGAQAMQHMVDHSYELLIAGVGANRPALGEGGARITEAAITTAPRVSRPVSLTRCFRSISSAPRSPRAGALAA